MISPALNEAVTLIANVALALSLVVAVVFGVAQVKAAARDRHERLTLDVLRNFQTREFAELIHQMTTTETPRTDAELKAMPFNDHVLFIQLGQQMESLGLLVAEGLIDIDLVDKTLGSFVTTTWEAYKPIFTDMRAKTPDPFLGEYFQYLAELIDAREKNNPRKPFYLTVR